MRIHLVTYAKGQPYEMTQRFVNETIDARTSYEVVKHMYNEDRIKDCEWFSHISDFPNRTIFRKHDDYFCAWKQFCVLDAMKKADEGDLIYYVDSSRYAITGFNENLDKFFEFASEIGGIFASCTDDVLNRSDNCADSEEFWNIMGLGHLFPSVLDKRHPLTAWYILVKNEFNTKIVEEMCDWIKFRFTDGRSLVEFHHTQEQTIHCAIMSKYGLKAFYCPGIDHNTFKDRNVVLNIVNNTQADLKNYMVDL
jgi:hypothetical protein